MLFSIYHDDDFNKWSSKFPLYYTFWSYSHDEVIKMETFSAVLSLCAGNPRYVLRSMHKFQLMERSNKRLISLRWSFLHSGNIQRNKPCVQLLYIFVHNSGFLRFISINYVLRANRRCVLRQTTAASLRYGLKSHIHLTTWWSEFNSLRPSDAYMRR